MKDIKRPKSTLEMWGGIECTVNRVNDTYYDQIERSGHESRIEDLEMFAGLGLKALRYPVLWDSVSQHSPGDYNWKWTDERLDALRNLGLRPIVGLLHHGSGPEYTSLIDPEFPEKLAQYARAVAERYPWVEDYTPVNEPLTTARFSGLYGFWYPHAKDERIFGQALLNQCRATALAMAEIRKANPRARLIQTEDLGKVWSTPHMAYQAAFENERRWLSLDILCGKLNPDHPMWSYLDMFGIDPASLEDAICLPDIIGINHYLTSERFLDENLDQYPVCYHGGNLHESYVDVEAVRVSTDGPAGPKVLLTEAWKRFQHPLAVTECHLCCSREEQMRWLMEVWQAAQDLREDGVDIKAVTAWSLLGAYDWNSALTQFAGHYEPGVYDLRSPSGPRSTALADMIQGLASNQEYDHPAFDMPGWWRRPERLHYFPGHYQADDDAPVGIDLSLKRNLARPILITGASGTLGLAFGRICDIRAIPFHLLARQDMDITDPDSVERALDLFQPWAIINGAGYVRVDEAENEPTLCWHINAKGPEILAKACARHGIPLIVFSSDLVFDGRARQPYMEGDKPAPLNVYGESKLHGERLVLDACSSSLIIRTSAFFGPWDNYNFLANAIGHLRAGRTFPAAIDSTVSPTYVPDLVNTALDLLIDREHGIWHVANSGSITWLDLAREAARMADLDETLIRPHRTKELSLLAPRPVYSVLGSEKANIMPTLESALERYYIALNESPSQTSLIKQP